MLTGAMRAARTAGVLRLERVWVVAVPVVLMLVLERIVTLYFIQWGLGVFAFFTNPYAELAGRAGPFSLRTALLTMSFAVTGYALLWAVQAVVEYAREVKCHGRRLFLRGGATGRLVVFGSLFVMLAYETTVVTSLPTAEELMASARADFRGIPVHEFIGAVHHDVPGIRRFCREQLPNPSRPHRLVAAMALERLDDGSDRTREILRSITPEEFYDPPNKSLMYRLWRIATGRCGFGPGRAIDPSPENRKAWETFRRECIP